MISVQAPNIVKPMPWFPGTNVKPWGLWDKCALCMPFWGMAGTKPYDMGQSHFVPTATGTPTWVTTPRGRMLSFGAGNYLSFGNVLPFGTDRTIFALFRLPSVASDQVIVGKFTDGNTVGQWLLQFDDVSAPSSNTDRLSYTCATAAGGFVNWPWRDSATTLVANTYYAAAVVHRWGVSLDMYINGRLDNGWSQNLTNTGASVSANATVVGNTESANKSMLGEIAILIVWNRILNSAEVAALSADPFLMIREPGFQRSFFGATMAADSSRRRRLICAGAN